MVSKPPRAMSSMERSGEFETVGEARGGSMDAGPEEPKQLPSELTQTTK